MSDRGERLKEAIRRRQHRKMLVLAQDLAVDESAISRWKSGGAMSLDHASKVCTVLDISMDWLLLGRGEMEGHKSVHVSDEERTLITDVRVLPPSKAREFRAILRSLVTLMEP